MQLLEKFIKKVLIYVYITIVTPNVVDGCGKTTQINLLKKTAENLNPYFHESLDKYYKMPAEFNWWFKESSPEEFCENIYHAVYLRNGERLAVRAKVLQKQIKDGKYVLIEGDRSIEEVNKDIVDLCNSRKIVIKHPHDFNVPILYKKEIERICEEINRNLINDVLFLMVTGSCARNTVIENWSDIDLILVLKENTHFYRESLKNIFSCSPIKIGYTIYSQKHFENLEVDFKTAFAIYQMRKKDYYFPTICKEKLNIPFVSKSKLKNYGKNILPSLAHTITRIVYDKDKSMANKLFKGITHIMRIVLFLYDYNPKSYYEVADKYSKISLSEKLDVEWHIKNKNFEQLCKFAIGFLDNYYEHVVLPQEIHDSNLHWDNNKEV